MKNILNVTITGGAGRIAFELLPLLCNGLVFSSTQKISINLYDIPEIEKKLMGVAMETEDGAYPLLEDIKISTKLTDAFDKCDVAILIGGYPHRPGIERSEMLLKNSEIFKEIGSYLNRDFSQNCKVLVVANPVNSLTTILAHYANKVPKKNFTGLSRLDYNRAKYIIAKKCNTKVDKVKNLIVWGNHSDTQYPDTSHCKIDGVPILDFLKGEEEWLHNTYVDTVASRWKKIVNNMETTSVMGPANAIKDHLRDWYAGTPESDYSSMAVISDGKSYSVPKGLCFSLPVETRDFEYKVVDNLVLDEFTKMKLEKSWNEIIEELKQIGFNLH